MVIGCSNTPFPGICITREDEDNEWDKVYTVECLDTTRVRDELELFIELCKA